MNQYWPRPVAALGYKDFTTLRPRQNGRHFEDDIFKCIFLNANAWIPITFSLKFVPQGPINNMPALVQIMAWRLPGDKPLSEPMMVSLPTHIWVTRPQWVNKTCSKRYTSSRQGCHGQGKVREILGLFKVRGFCCKSAILQLAVKVREFCLWATSMCIFSDQWMMF